MKIGLISDTHNNIDITKRAVEVFKERNVDMVIHGGDLTSPRMIDLFKELSCIFILGNGDFEVELINKKSRNLGFAAAQYSCDLKLDNKRLFAMHGNDAKTIKDVIRSGEYDYIIKGHTHCYENYISNNTRVINPGSLQDGKENFIAILNTGDDEVDKIRIEV
ncbi:MAG: YfcE family phosphodiesterase [Spirochaetota bacterium]|nr:YfcE family phosphodiesterase [Spirochaetota bacterium]